MPTQPVHVGNRSILGAAAPPENQLAPWAAGQRACSVLALCLLLFPSKQGLALDADPEDTELRVCWGRRKAGERPLGTPVADPQAEAGDLGPRQDPGGGRRKLEGKGSTLPGPAVRGFC